MAKKSKEEVSTTVRVRNTRAGAIHLLPYGEFTLEPGVAEYEVSRFKALSSHVREHLTDLELEGFVVFGEDPEVEPAHELVVTLPEDFQPLPGDDELAAEEIKRETSAAVLDAWFALEAHRSAVSDAIFSRLKELGGK